MILAQGKDLSISFGTRPLLDNANFQINQGDKVCLIGRNGEGKSTLLKIIAGHIQADSGELSKSQQVTISELQQEIPPGEGGTIYDIVATGLGTLGEKAVELNQLNIKFAETGDEKLLADMEKVQNQLEDAGGWEALTEIDKTISKLNLDPAMDFSSLSGGLKRRVLLGKALVSNPSLLLLDEPTNHLDINAIQWLEEFLAGYQGTLLFITHDRVFLQKIANRIFELDRGQLTDWPENYDNYLRRKQERSEAEAKQNQEFDKKLAQEEAWIRQGIKARRTRNEGRVRALKELRKERQQRREKVGNAKLRLQQADKSGKKVILAEGIQLSYDNRPIIKDFSSLILRGDKIGVIGPNGSGKTSLLKILLGENQGDQGEVTLGTNLDIAFFDQLRNQLDEDKSIRDNVGQGRDTLTINGNQKHIVGYLQDFLFSPERINSPVKALSGGERNRVLLAKLFTKPANLLVMDEPTNDLDVETLELLEALLVEFSGTLLLVSHDRAFLNNVVSSTIVFEGDGVVNEYIGGYDDWVRQAPEAAVKSGLVKDGADKETASKPQNKEKKKKSSSKLSYKDQRELELLPAKIETLETEVEEIQAEISTPEFFQQDPSVVSKKTQLLEDKQKELEVCYEDWERLEALKEELENG